MYIISKVRGLKQKRDMLLQIPTFGVNMVGVKVR